MVQEKRSVLSTFGFVLGILSILSLGIMTYGYLTLILGVVSIILNIIALVEIKTNKKKGKAFAVIGIVLGIIAIFLALILYSTFGSILFG